MKPRALFALALVAHVAGLAACGSGGAGAGAAVDAQVDATTGDSDATAVADAEDSGANASDSSDAGESTDALDAIDAADGADAYDESSATDSADADTLALPADSMTGDASDAVTDAGTSLPLQGNVLHVTACTEAAIVTAIAAANAGDTVYFPPCIYEISTTITLKGGVLFHGEGGAILHSASGTTIFRGSGAQVTGVSIDGLTFDGGNLILNSGSTTAFSSNVTMVNCTIRNVLTTASFGLMQGVLIDHLRSSHFDFNTFTNDGVEGNIAYALIAYSTNDSSFSHNTLTNTFQGFHFESADATGGNNLDVSYNRGSGLLGIGIEFNKNVSHSMVQGNQFDSWRPGDANGMGLSIVPSLGTANTVQNNLISGAGCATCNIGIEAGGTNSTFQGNFVDGFYANVAVACAVGTVISGNTLNNAGMWGTFDKDGGWCAGSTIGTNTINGMTRTGWTF